LITTLVSPVTINIKARDEDISSAGTPASFTIEPNFPPVYAGTVPTSFEMNHNEINKDFLLPLRSICNETCTPSILIPIPTPNVLPVTVSIFTDSTDNDYIRANAEDLSYLYTPGTHTMVLQISDADGCSTNYSISLTVKNTKARLTAPVVIPDFELPMNQIKYEDVTTMEDDENSMILMTCWKVVAGV